MIVPPVMPVVAMSESHTPQGQPLDPSPLMQLSTAYWDAQTLLTANRMRLFDLLAKGPMTAAEVASALATAPRYTLLFLRACVALGLLVEADNKFTNSGLSEQYLVAGKPTCLADAFRYSDDLYPTWGQLEQSLKEGAPQLRAESYLGDDEDRTRHFVYGMHNRALGIGRALVELVDLSGRTQMLDIGGGPGTYSALLTARFPSLQSRVLELPGVAAIAREILASMDASGQVSMLPGSYYDTPFPEGNDVVLVSGVFHRESEANCRDLIARAAASLAPGGLLIVSDVFTTADGAEPPFAALFGLNMMLTAPDGGVHADAAVAAWMEAAGLQATVIRQFPPPMPHRLVQGVKP